MRTPAILFAIGLTAISQAHGGGAVTLCGADDEGGAGLNLGDALEGGGFVEFRCSPGTVITMHRLHTLGRAILIDGGDAVTLDAGGSAMFSTVGSSVPIRFRNIELRNGRARAPFVTNSLIQGDADLTLDHVQINSSEKPILAHSVTISDSTFTGNTGGAVITTWIADIKGSQFSDNAGPPLQQPQLRPGPWSRATIEGTHFNGNGPIYWDGTSEIRAGSSFVANGRGATNGGALWLAGEATIENTEFINNHAVNGGAVWLEVGSLSVRRSTFRGNRVTERGGAIGLSPAPDWAGSANITLAYSTFRENKAAAGGGAISSGRREDQDHPLAHLVGDAVTFARNYSAGSGGAIEVGHGSVTLSRALFVANEAAVAGGAIFSGSQGPEDKIRLGNALVVRNTGGGFRAGLVELVNSTVADNQGFGFRMRPPGELKLKNTIVLNNNGGNCAPIPNGMLYTDAGNNIQYPGTDCGPTLPSTDPALDTFYVPLVGSPARFGGDNTTCVQDELVRARDIYSTARPEASRCTIGAVEGDLERHALRALRRPREQPLAEPLKRLLEGLGIRRYATTSAVHGKQPIVFDRQRNQKR